MKQFYFLFTLVLATSVYSQVPSNYYDSASGLSGYALKTQLNSIITSGHSDQGYGGLWIAYQTTDRDLYYENDNTILDIYSENPTGADDYSFTQGSDQCGTYSIEGDCYNREHIVPQSVFNEASPMRNDVHQVYPTDGKVNGLRSNYPFGTVASASTTSSNGSKLGNSSVSGYSGTVFEPLDEFKGDVARALLYFATRYETTVDSYPFDMFDGTEDHVFDNWAIDMLLDWHYNVDPVDQRDIDRNNAAYNFQGNANPFISHPEYANLIWNPIADTEDPTSPTSLVASNPSSSTIDLTWTASTDNIAVTSYDIFIDGSFYVNTNSAATFYTVTGLNTETSYCFTLFAKDASGNISTVSNQDCTATLEGSSGATELFISEYVEGSGNNKVLEIANFTGVTVDLSAYTIKKSINGDVSWDTAVYSFPNGTQITDGDVYVVANNFINTGTCVTSAVDDLTNSSVFQFNGNDPVGLFNNDVLIDIIGTLGGGSGNFAVNTTLIRDPDILEPSTTYISTQWSNSSQDSCSDLGTHTITPLAVTYTYSGSWSPSNPTGVSTMIDDVIVDSGDLVLDNDLNCNSLTVNSGASITVSSGVVLTTNTAALNSTSQTFSSVISNGTIYGTVSYSRYTAQVFPAGSNDLISAPLSGQNFGDFNTANADLAASGTIRAFAPYNTASGNYENYDTSVNDATLIASGVGFRAATNTGSNLNFTGSVGSTDVLDVSISDAAAGSAWNLIGNPYPSYIDFDAFFQENKDEFNSSGPFQAIYGYDGDASDGWTVWNQATIDEGSLVELIAPGQGFFVKAKSGGGLVDFTAAMRVSGSSDDFILNRSSSNNAVLCKLNLVNTNDKLASTDVFFIEGTTRGLDNGYDAGLYYGNEAEFSIYSNLVVENSSLDLAIQTLPFVDLSDVVIPLGINAAQGVQLSISIADVSTLPENINVYLDDITTNTQFLLNDSDYVFTPMGDLSGVGRFFLRFSSSVLTVATNNWDDLAVYASSSPREVIISGNLSSATSVGLYDLQGRLIISKSLDESSSFNTLDVSTVTQGVYIVKVYSKNEVKTKKLIIK